jgi:hypothetical protein
VVYGVPTIGLAGRTIQYGEGTTVTGLTKPGSLVNVYGYTRPSTTYARLGQVRSDARGRYSFSTRLAANSRLYVVVPRLGKSVVVAQGVRSVVSLVATRTSRTTYWFAGTASPVHAGQLVTIYVRTARGGKAIFARTRADQNGDYRVSRTVAAYGTQTNVVFAHVGSGIVMLGNNSPDRTIVTNRAR